MAKITRHGGPSDAYDPDRPDKLLEPHEGGNPVTPDGRRLDELSDDEREQVERERIPTATEVEDMRHADTSKVQAIEDAGELETVGVGTPLGEAPEGAVDPRVSDDPRVVDEPQDDTEPAESGDDGDEPDEVEPAGDEIDLPPVNALRSVWEQALIDAGVSEQWVRDAENKDALITAGRGLADGSQVVVDGVPVDAK